MVFTQLQYARAITHRWTQTSDSLVYLSPTLGPGRFLGASDSRLHAGRSQRSMAYTDVCSSPSASYATPTLHMPLAVPTPLFGHRLGLAPYLCKDTVFGGPHLGPHCAWTPRLRHRWGSP